MLALTWLLNSTPVARIQLFLLNEFVNHSGISKLEHMSNKTGYPDTPPTLLLFEMVQIKLLALHYRSEKKKQFRLRSLSRHELLDTFFCICANIKHN